MRQTIFVAILSVIFIGCSGDSGGGGGGGDTSSKAAPKPGGGGNPDTDPGDGDGDGGGDPVPPPTPQVSVTATRVLNRLSTGNEHTCAVSNKGTVFCWGNGTFGKLGNDAESNTDHPVTVVDGDGSTTPLKGIVQVATGDSFSCALSAGGGVLCWGSNNHGQLGNGDSSVTKTDHPVAVVDGAGNALAGIVQIDAESNHSCAVTGEGGVLCWGSNDQGKLGFNSANANSDHAVAVVDGDGSTTALTGIVQVATGSLLTCAMTDEGGVLCWGQAAKRTSMGYENVNYPVVLNEAQGVPLTGIAYVVAHNNICVVTTGGSAKCMGFNEYGQLGNGKTSQTSIIFPVDVVDGAGSTTALTGIVGLDMDADHTCAVMDDGRVTCWGTGHLGRLGHNSTSDSHHPVDVVSADASGVPLENVVQVSAGDAYSCALTSGGQVYCWGIGSSGQLGSDGTDNKNHPVSVVDGDGSTTVLNIGARSSEYSCYDDNSCRFEAKTLMTVTAVDGESGSDATPDVAVGNVEGGQTVSLHLDGACAGGAIGSATVATGESSVTITPTVALTALNNHLYAKVGSDCSTNRGSYTLTGADPLVAKSKYRVGHAILNLVVNHLTSGDTISLHLSEDCSDNSLAGTTAVASSTTLSLYSLEGRNITFHLKKNGVCYSEVFEYERVTYTGDYGKVSGGKDHTCAVDVRGGVRCWGLNGSGQLGNDSETDSNDPEVVVDGDGSSNPLLGVVQVAAGRGHTCALMEKAGAVKCWGAGARGRLGDGGNAKKDHPVDVVGVGGTGTLSGIVQLDAGDNHTCAVTGEGGVVCWGIGDNGRLGNNAVADSASPVKVVEGSAPLTGIVQVSAGIEHACALTNQGGIVCWGKGQNGQFGNGTNPTGQRTAVSALVSTTDQSPLSGAVQVSVGGYRTCALMEGGGIKCWGTDAYGELGNVGTGQQKYPVNVTDSGGTAITGMMGVSAGREHTCAVAMGGGVKCWGRGNQGQMGNGIESNEDHPVDVTGSELFIALAGSKGNHQCALTRAGEVMCWGFNFYGGLGDDTNDKKSAPVAVVADHGETRALGVGNWRREYRCYGDDSCDFDRESFDVPMLKDPTEGDPSGTDSTPAFTVTNLKSFESVSLHSNVSCTTTALASGRVANGSSTLSLTSSALAAVKNAVFVKRGDQCRPHRTDYTYESGTARITGDAEGADRTPSLTINLLAASDTLSLHRSPDCSDSALASATATGASEEVTLASLGSPGIHHLYLKQNGVCHLHPFRYTLEQGPLPPFSVGATHSCLQKGGAFKCWGDNDYGQIGDKATTDREQPVVVTTLGNNVTVKAISAGIHHTCAILQNNSVKCWGRNDESQAGPGNSETCRNGLACAKTAVAPNLGSGRTAKALSSGSGDHTCAIRDNDTLVCWGHNDYGQLGDGSTTNRSVPVAVNVGSNRTVQAVSTGVAHTCALLDNDTLKCWGWNDHGQLGYGDTTDRGDESGEMGNSLGVVNVGSGRTVRAVSAGPTHTCALLDNDTLKCWGNNTHGQLGYGDENHRGDDSGEMGNVLGAVNVGASRSVVSVSVGDSRTCAVLDNGSVACWGGGFATNALGQGSGATLDTCARTDDYPGSGCLKTPGVVALPANRTARAIGTGYYHTCALMDDDSAMCWGRDNYAQIGTSGANNGTETPVTVEFGD